MRFFASKTRGLFQGLGLASAWVLLIMLGWGFTGGLVLQAQEPPERIINQPCTSCEPKAVHMADLDDDGNPDVLVASRFDNKLVWHRNIGGGYGDQQVISASFAVDDNFNNQPMYAADIDGDGDLDVVAGSGPDEKAVWFENQIGESEADSDGFGPAQTITTSEGGVYAVAAAQINGDSRADVVLGTSDSGIIWFESQIGEPGDDFSAANTIASPTDAPDPTNIAVADFSGDTKPDVAYAVLGEIAWHENTGGSFGAKTSITTNTLGKNGLVVGDVDDDDDDDLDLVASSSADANITWYENTGGAFGGEVIIESDVQAQAVAAADVDDDGKDDVLTAISPTTGGDDRVSWYESQIGEAEADSDGFGDEQVITISLLGPRDLATANVDGGSDVELLSASEFDEKIAWFENTGGGYGVPQPVNTWPDAVNPRSVVATDLDSDTDTDVLVASALGNKISWYKNVDSDGTFSDQKVIADDVPEAFDAQAADLNGDGAPDVIVGPQGFALDQGKIAWYENQIGDAGADADGFGSEQIITQKDDMQALAIADIDGDGDNDVVITYGLFSTGIVAWYENQIGETGADGDGFSDEQVIDSNFQSPVSVAVADLNGNGDPDILVGGGGFGNGELVWYENTDGNGTFSAKTVITGTIDGDVADLTTADLDGDNDPDVLAAITEGTGEITWFENEIGQGGDSDGFSAVVITDVVNGGIQLAVHAADVNSDGAVDVLSASGIDNTVAWYANDGNASFGSQDVIATSEQGSNPSKILGAADVTTADVNGDTETDVLSAATGFERIAWYENIDGVLPVELAEFSAIRTEQGTQLTWSTASETNNAGFEVQHADVATEGAEDTASESTTSWSTLGFVEGAGTTDEPQSYTFTAEDLSVGTHRFRLRQVDTDGTESFSEPVEVKVGLDETYILSNARPTPTHSQATLELAVQEAQSVTAEVYDVLGRRVRTVHNEEVPAEREITLDVDASTLSSGTYFVRVKGETFTATRRLTVVR